MEPVATSTVDYLEQDPALRGQSFVCLSFISPEDVIVKREAFFLQKFVSAVGQDVWNLLDGVVENFGTPKEGASQEEREKARAVIESINIVKQRHEYLQSPESMDEEFKFFSSKKAMELEQEFNETVGFRTSVRGIKVRGVYANIKEAKNRTQQIQRFDKNHNVYIAEVGCWCPWSPNPDDMQNANYTETSLNTLMKKYKENREMRDDAYEKRRLELIKEMGDVTTSEKKAVQASCSSAVEIEEVTGSVVLEPPPVDILDADPSEPIQLPTEPTAPATQPAKKKKAVSRKSKSKS